MPNEAAEKVKLRLNFSSVDLEQTGEGDRDFLSLGDEQYKAELARERIGIPTREAVQALQIEGISLDSVDEKRGVIVVSYQEGFRVACMDAVAGLCKRRSLNQNLMWTAQIL